MIRISISTLVVVLATFACGRVAHQNVDAESKILKSNATGSGYSAFNMAVDYPKGKMLFLGSYRIDTKGTKLATLAQNNHNLYGVLSVNGKSLIQVKLDALEGQFDLSSTAEYRQHRNQILEVVRTGGDISFGVFGFIGHIPVSKTIAINQAQLASPAIVAQLADAQPEAITVAQPSVEKYYAVNDEQANEIAKLIILKLQGSDARLLNTKILKVNKCDNTSCVYYTSIKWTDKWGAEPYELQGSCYWNRKNGKVEFSVSHRNKSFEAWEIVSSKNTKTVSALLPVYGS
jgi:hypothetical protein